MIAMISQTAFLWEGSHIPSLSLMPRRIVCGSKPRGNSIYERAYSLRKRPGWGASLTEGAVCQWHTIKAPTEPAGEKGITK